MGHKFSSFSNEETKAQRVNNLPKYTQSVAEMELQPRLSASKAHPPFLPLDPTL